MIHLLKRIARRLGFHVHEWGNWTTIGDIYMKDRHIGRSQMRTCQTCSKLQANKVWLV